MDQTVKVMPGLGYLSSVEQKSVRVFLRRKPGRTMSMKDVVLKYPIWQDPYRAAVIETDPKLFKQKSFSRTASRNIATQATGKQCRPSS
jgi:hypothetical protein